MRQGQQGRLGHLQGIIAAPADDQCHRCLGGDQTHHRSDEQIAQMKINAVQTGDPTPPRTATPTIKTGLIRSGRSKLSPCYLSSLL